MSTTPAVTGYSRLQIILHWLVFPLIAQQYIFKDAMSAAWDRLAEGLGATFDPLVLAHVAGGALILIFALWRLMLRARRGVPPAIEATKVQGIVAKLTHVGLYALMILMPVSGAVAWIGGVEAAAQGHNVMKIILLALLALHIVGALYHQVVLRDGTLARMRRAQG
ncbi:cytochrome b/b6 domain-containing protein [Rhodobacteraceae bacterium N5(2021)]|uniref:Cytochrome b/b6 domain-containing protein n=1 Tax=Gymnodinialimonas phycosphaerae TaxID=2841589 RepID=A0A975YGV2_9RHOB|nr:cytochrome b/b6 domain-containing protein [Gymnodinialimonas phycosphaerae]MBY4891949.1 cytochrome b/b6 domain-containing protein [Gymnodinialimonas phycosphaerae]